MGILVAMDCIGSAKQPAEGTALERNGSHINGRLVFSIDQLRLDNSSLRYFRYSTDFTCDITRDDNDRWIGSWNNGERIGQVIGWDETPQSGAASTFALDAGLPYGSSEDDPHLAGINLLVDFDVDGNPTSLDVMGSTSRSSCYGTNPPLTPLPSLPIQVSYTWRSVVSILMQR